MDRFLELFQGEDGRMSMSRLLSFMSFFPATVVLIRVNTAECMAYFVGAYVLNYIGGRSMDAWSRRPASTTIVNKNIGES